MIKIKRRRVRIINLLFIVGNAFLDSINDGLYVAGREAVDTRFWSSGLEDTGNYLFTYDNNGAAALVVNRELLGSGSGLDNRYGLPMNSGLSFYDANIDEIRTGSIYGAAAGTAVFGGVVFAPTIASLATSAYYATGPVAYTAIQTANYYTGKIVETVGNASYKIGVQYVSEVPNIVNVGYKVGEFARGLNPEVAGAPDTEWSQIGGLTRGLFDEVMSFNADLVELETNVKHEAVDNDY